MALNFKLRRQIMKEQKQAILVIVGASRVISREELAAIYSTAGVINVALPDTVLHHNVGTPGHINHGAIIVESTPSGADTLLKKFRQNGMSETLMLQAQERRFMVEFELDPVIKKIVHGPIIKRGKGKTKRW